MLARTEIPFNFRHSLFEIRDYLFPQLFMVKKPVIFFVLLLFLWLNYDKIGTCPGEGNRYKARL